MCVLCYNMIATFAITQTNEKNESREKYMCKIKKNCPVAALFVKVTLGKMTKIDKRTNNVVDIV